MKYQTATKSQLWNLVKSLQNQLADTQDALNTRSLDLMKEQEKVEELEETVSIQKTLISSLEDDLEKKDQITYKQEVQLEQASKAYEACAYNLQTTIDQLVDKNKENEELRGRFGALVHEHSTEVSECTKLLQQLKDSNTKLNKELDEAKEEAALLRKYEAVAQKKIEKATQDAEKWKYLHGEYGDRLVEARNLTWDLYNLLVLEESKGLDIELYDVQQIIELLHD